MPPEITSLIPSSTEMSRMCTSLSGTNKRKPVVGLGVAGMKTLMTLSPVRRCTSPTVWPVTKPTAQVPRRGYSIRQTSLKAFDCWARTVSKICFVPL